MPRWTRRAASRYVEMQAEALGVSGGAVQVLDS